MSGYEFGDITAVFHGKAAIIKEVPAVVQKWSEENAREAARVLPGILDQLKKQTKALREKSADEVVTISWYDFVDPGANEVLAAMNSVAETYPEIQIAIEAELDHSSYGTHIVYKYYSAAGSPTILVKQPQAGGYIDFLDVDTQCDVAFPQEDWIPWVMSYTDISELVFQDKIFVLTGFGKKEEKEVEELITSRGGIVKSSTVLKTDYLIVHKDRKSQTTKYQRARELNEQGKHIAIISSETFYRLGNFAVDRETGGEMIMRIHGEVGRVASICDELSIFTEDFWIYGDEAFSDFEEQLDSWNELPDDAEVTVEWSLFTNRSLHVLKGIDELVAFYNELEVAIDAAIFDFPTPDKGGTYRYYSPAGKKTILPDGVKRYFDDKLLDVKLPDVDWIPADWNER